MPIDFWNTQNEDALATRALLERAIGLVGARGFYAAYLDAALPEGHTIPPAIAAAIRLAGRELMERYPGAHDLANGLMGFILYGTFEEVGAAGVGSLDTEARGSLFVLLTTVAKAIIQEHVGPDLALLDLTPGVPVEEPAETQT